MPTPHKTPQRAVIKPTSRRYTTRLTGIFLVILSLTLLVALVPLTGSLDRMDSTNALQVQHLMRENGDILLIWRLVLYTTTLLGFYYFVCHRLNRGKVFAIHSILRVGCCVVLFELLIVQNVAGKALSLLP